MDAFINMMTVVMQLIQNSQTQASESEGTLMYKYLEVISRCELLFVGVCGTN